MNLNIDDHSSASARDPMETNSDNEEYIYSYLQWIKEESENWMNNNTFTIPFPCDFRSINY